MKTKLLAISCALLLLWGGMFITDYTCINALREPIFARASDPVVMDRGSSMYIGLGYTVQVHRVLDVQNIVHIESVEMRLFGRMVAGSISCR